MDVLRQLVRQTLAEARQFTEWLSPDVMRLLILNYAEKSSDFGILKWQYAKLSGRTWGVFSEKQRMLIVNQAKTKDRFKQQVETILHEIQHWNQFVAFAALHDGSATAWGYSYDNESRRTGYYNNKYEVDARAFATQNLQDAVKKIGAHYGGRVEGEMDDVIEELVDLYTDEDEPLSRRDIGQTLVDFGFVGPKFMQQALEQLRDLDVEIRG